jgi:signal transduction histidine kinase
MARRSVVLDLVIAVAVVVAGQLEAWQGIGATLRQGPHWAEAVLYGLTGAAIAARRLDPLGCLAAIVAISAADFVAFGAPEGNGIMWPGLIAGYSVARWEVRRPPWWGLVLLVVLGVAWDLRIEPDTGTLRTRVAALFWLSLWIIAWLVGALVRSQLQNLEQRRSAAAQRTSQALAEERNRIARELHDIVGHSVSVMTVQASAVRRRLHSEQDVERQALESVESVGREAMAEMRRLVAVLRSADGEADREPPPGLVRIDRLADKIRSAGLAVSVQVTGDPRPLPRGLDLTAYRVVQEGLTNALRHATSASHADVTIRFGADCLELAIRDDGLPPAPRDDGHGLLGMRERVAVYGGTLVARPRPDRGFELLARLPLEPG